MRRTRIRLGAALLVVGLVLGASGGAATAREKPTDRRSPDAVATTKGVRIIDFAFSPRAITISRGTRVVWTNTGSVAHTSTSNTGRWNSGRIAPGGSFGRVFKTAGIFLYHCRIHPSMKARITVT